MKNTITRAQIDALLAASEIDVTTKFDKVTVVTVKLPNGFVLVEASGAVDKANYSEELGRKTCLDRIAVKLWSFEGYRLGCLLASDLPAIGQEFAQLCYAIEQIPFSPEQTEVSVRASNLHNRLAALC